MRNPPTIGVFGHYGNQNLGDEAITTAVIQRILQYWPAARIWGFSVNPADTSERYHVPAFPIRRPVNVSGGNKSVAEANQAEARHVGKPHAGHWLVTVKSALKQVPLLKRAIRVAGWLLRSPQELMKELRFLKDSYRRLREVDLLLISGSNQFLDNFGGPMGFPYTLLKWSVLAKLAGCKLAFVSVGAGPIDALSSRLMVRLALLFSDYLSFRDESSKRLIETVGLRGRGLVYPDLAHGLLPEEAPLPRDIDAKPERPTVGINPMPMYDSRYWCVADDRKYRDYVGRLAEIAAALQQGGYPLFFFATQPKDENVIHDVLDSLEMTSGGVVDREKLIRRSDSVSGIMRVFGSADLIIATRFHGTLLALLAERPVLGVCYYRKTRDLLREMGQEDYAVDLEDFTVADVLLRFKRLEDNRLAETEKIRRKNQEYCQALANQYERVFSLLGPAGRRDAGVGDSRSAAAADG